jgi:MFS transporter, SP family, arabinose:H+ symporter
LNTFSFKESEATEGQISLASRTTSGKPDLRFIGKVSAVAAFGGFLFGYDTAIISGTIPYITQYFKLDEYLLGWAVSSILIGCAAGATLAGKAADKYGRRFALIACAILFAISGIGAGLSSQLYTFILFRILGGLGVGAAAMLSPMYIAEMAPPAWRGRLVACYQMAIVIGIMVAYFANYWLDGLGANNWRWMFATQAFPSAVFLGLLLLVPETPRWLIMKRRMKEARRVMTRIAGGSPDAELAVIERSFHNEQSVSLRQLFSKPYRLLLLIGILVAVFQQVTGINAVIYYAPEIFKETGVGGASSLQQTIAVGVVNIVSTFLAIGLVDRLGRRKLLLAGCLMMGLSMAGVATCFLFSYFDNYVVLVLMLLYVASFGATLGAVTWVYLSEMFPNLVRSFALSVATLCLWLADFAVTISFPVMTKKLGTAFTMYTYAALCAVAFAFFLWKLKETKGRTLEEIENLFIH